MSPALRHKKRFEHVWEGVNVLCIGAILAPGEHTVTMLGLECRMIR
jgi:hypothetical protein